MEAKKKPIREKPFVEEENLSSRKKVKIVDLFAGCEITGEISC